MIMTNSNSRMDCWPTGYLKFWYEADECKTMSSLVPGKIRSYVRDLHWQFSLLSDHQPVPGIWSRDNGRSWNYSPDISEPVLGTMRRFRPHYACCFPSTFYYSDCGRLSGWDQMAASRRDPWMDQELDKYILSKNKHEQAQSWPRASP